MLFTEGLFPQALKIAKVTPIYKTGSKLDPGNYRPVSVLPTISKILEKIIHNRLNEYLLNIKLLYKGQYGFRAKSNTLSACIDLVTTIRSHIDKKDIALGVFIDLKKAFDTVSHSLLLKKLEHIGIIGPALKILKSYLENRYQIVKIGNYESSSEPVTCGVPQGSILGPLLFLVYVNNLHQAELQGNLTLYADDTCLFYFGKNIETIMHQAQHDMKVLETWFQYNLLTINTSKSSYVIFKAKNKIVAQHPDLTINGIALHERQQEKYLGLTLDNKLTWRAHIQQITKKLSSLVGSLYNIARCIPRKARLLIYNSLVKPHLLYLIELWGCAAKTNLNHIQALQNKLVKILHHYHYLTSSRTIYKETKLMNIKQLHTYNTCILIYKIIHKLIHSDITFTLKSQINKYASRRHTHLAIPRVRTKYGKNNLTFVGAQLYNKLPKTVRDATSLRIFKKRLREHISNDDSYYK